MDIKLLESIKSKLEKVNIFPEEDEIIAYGNEIVLDIDYLTNVDVTLELCTNAIIEGVLSKYLPDRLPLYLQQIKVIRLNAYKSDEPEDTQDGRIIVAIKNELKKLDLPKIDNSELNAKLNEVKKDVVNLTNVSIDLEICNNALIIGVLAKFQPDRKVLYDEQIKVIRLNAYNDDSYANLDGHLALYLRAIKDELKKMDLPKISNDELTSRIQEVQSDITSKTNVDVNLALCDNAVIIGVLANYQPARKALYDEQITFIKLHAYDNEPTNPIKNAIQDKLRYLSIPKISDDELNMRIVEVKRDIFNLTNVNTDLDICNSAIIFGVVAKYQPEIIPLYQEQIKVIRLNAYNDDSYVEERDDRIIRIFRTVKNELKKLDLPKVSDDDLYRAFDEVILDIKNKTKVDYKEKVIIYNKETIQTNQYCENGIIQGILSKYDAQRLPLYQEQIQSIMLNAYSNDTYEEENRTVKILKSVKDYIKTLNIQKESNQDILDRANEVQTDIMMRTKILDKSFTITTMANLSDYVSEINDRFEIRDIINMTTKRSLHYIALANVSKVMNTQGTSPVYVTVYDKEVSFIPTPTASENITFLTYQKSVQEPMGIDVEPELPVSCDNAIIHGTMAKYDPKMFELYQVDINLLLETKTKYSGQYQHRNTIKSSW